MLQGGRDGLSYRCRLLNNIYDNPADIVGSVSAIADHFQAIEIELEEKARLAVSTVPAITNA